MINLTLYAILFTLSAIGIDETVYLIKMRWANQRPVCVIGSDCHKVLESKYNNIGGLHNDILGFIFYAAMAILTAFLVIGLGPLGFWDSIARLLLIGGVAFSTIAIYIQGRIIKAWCFWCLLSSITVFLMAVIVFGDLIT